MTYFSPLTRNKKKKNVTGEKYNSHDLANNKEM